MGLFIYTLCAFKSASRNIDIFEKDELVAKNEIAQVIVELMTLLFVSFAEMIFILNGNSNIESFSIFVLIVLFAFTLSIGRTIY